MSLKLVVDKIDDVPEAIRGEYVEKDGKFQLNVDDLPDITPLKKAVEAERKARSALETKIKAWEKLGKSTDEIQGMIEEFAKIEEGKLTQAGEWDKLKAQMNAKHSDEVKALLAKLDAKDGELKSVLATADSRLIRTEATAAIAAAKGVPELLLPHVQQFLRVDDKGNVTVVDAQGGPRVNGKGDPLTVNDLVNELKASDLFGRAFEGSGNSGSGMRPTTGAGGSGVQAKYKKRSDFKTERERADFIDTEGLDAYRSLPA